MTGQQTRARTRAAAAAVVEQQASPVLPPGVTIPEGDVLVLQVQPGPEGSSTSTTDGRSSGRAGRMVQFEADVVDNEFLGRKSSKVCCIYHKPKQRNHGGDTDSDSSSDSSDTDGDNPDVPNAYERQPRSVRKAIAHKKNAAKRAKHDEKCSHNHNHNHNHDDDKGKGNEGQPST